MVFHITGRWPEASECFARAEQLLAGARASYYRVERDGAAVAGAVAAGALLLVPVVGQFLALPVFGATTAYFFLVAKLKKI